MPTFDVVSEVDMQEVRNAVDQARREIANRYDFKDTDSSIELEGQRRSSSTPRARSGSRRSRRCSRRRSSSARCR